MAVSMIGPKFYAWDRNGKPLAGGKLYTYQARTNTPKATYQSEDQEVENTNPVILNGEGYANVYLDGSYKMVLKDSKDTEIWSSDPVTSAQADEWTNCFAATYTGPSAFKVAGNQTDIYIVGRTLRINNNASEYEYVQVESAVYASGETSVVVNEPVVTTGLNSVCTSVISIISHDSTIFREKPGSHPGSAISLEQGGSVQTAITYVTPEMFGSTGDVADDSTQAMIDVIAFCKANKVALELYGDYRVTEVLDFSTMVVNSHGANIYKDHNGIGIVVQGDAVYTDFNGQLHVHGYGDAFSDASAAAPVGKENDHGIKITGRCRVNGVLFSRNHYGNGFDIETIGNMNKCIFKSLWSLCCSGYGMLFHGTRDDASVWEISTYSQYCWLGGQYIPDDYAGRQWVWYCYEEGTTNPYADYGVYIGSLKASKIFIYPEEQTASSSATVYISPLSDSNLITETRATRVQMESETTGVFYGSVPYLYGDSGQKRGETVCANLTNNVNKTITTHVIGAGGPTEILSKEIHNGAGGWDVQAQNRSTETIFASIGVINSSARAKGYKSNGRADFFLDSYRGTPTDPLPIQSGSIASRLAGRINVDTSGTLVNAMSIQARVIGTPTAVATTTRMEFAVNQASSDVTTVMTLGEDGVLNVPAGYTPFTGMHFAVADEELTVGYAVVVDGMVELAIEKGSYDEDNIFKSDIEQRRVMKVSHCKEAMSKRCVGIVESCDKQGDKYFIKIAAVGDSSTENLKGFMIASGVTGVEAGDILCTSDEEGKLMLCPENVGFSVTKFKSLENQTSDTVYGYFI